MASKQTSQNFKFQYYIDMAKQKKIHWNVFVNLMEDLSYSNIDRLKYLIRQQFYGQWPCLIIKIFLLQGYYYVVVW